MAEIQNDAEVVQQTSRPNRLKDVDAPLRDQIPKKLRAKLIELEMGPKIQKMWNDGNAKRQERLNRQEEFLKDWDEFLEASAEGPFQGVGAIHLPVTLIACKALHARFLQALVGVDPFFNLKARREDSVDRVHLVSNTLDYTLREWCNYRQGIEKTLDEWVWAWITQGKSTMKNHWDCTYSSYIDVVEELEQASPEFSPSPSGEVVAMPRVKKVEKERRVTKKIFEGPCFFVKNEEDFLVVGGNGEVDQADATLDRYYLTASQLWTLVDRKVFEEAAVKKVIKGGNDTEDGAIASNIKQQRSENAGIENLDSDVDLDRYEIVEAHLKTDVDGSGIVSDIIVWVHLKSAEILRSTYLYRVNKAGERPYFQAEYHKRSTDNNSAMGIPEMIHPLAKEMDAQHSIRVDYGILSSLPFGFYRPSSNIEPNIISIQPGTLIPVDNPQTDVYFPNLGNRTAFSFQEESAIYTFIERLTGVNDLTTAAMSGTQGAARTATGARALLGESNTNLDVHLRRLQRAWKKCLEYTLHQLQQRIPEGLAFRVTGESGNDYWAQIKTRDDIAGDYDFELSGNSVTSNKAVQQELASQIFQFTQNPLLIQSGIVSAGNIWEAAKNWFRMNGVKEYTRYITKPPQHMHLLTPEDEANRILQGIPVPVTPEMDHEGFIAYFEEIKASDELLGQFNEAQTIQLAAQAAKHAQMLQALEAAQAQMLNQQQMQTNAQMGAEAQSNPGLPVQPGPTQPGA